MALEGGIGFIHRGMSIAAQAERVASVKRTQGHVVEQPWCLPRGSTIREACEFTRTHQISGILMASPSRIALREAELSVLGTPVASTPSSASSSTPPSPA